MYWTNDRIEKDPDSFGMDFLPGYDKPEIIRDLLATCLNGAKDAGSRSMYHWPDTQRDQEIALSLGFRCLAAARCIKGRL